MDRDSQSRARQWGLGVVSVPLSSTGLLWGPMGLAEEYLRQCEALHIKKPNKDIVRHFSEVEAFEVRWYPLSGVYGTISCPT